MSYAMWMGAALIGVGSFCAGIAVGLEVIGPFFTGCVCLAMGLFRLSVVAGSIAKDSAGSLLEGRPVGGGVESQDPDRSDG